jgi:hypothetical protein
MATAIEHTLDHVVIHVGRELDAAAAWLATLGFEVSPRGRHSIGTANHLVVFGRTYLELIGLPADFSGAAPTWLVTGPVGLKALALRSMNAAALQLTLRRRAVRTDELLDVSRAVTIDGTTGIAAFRVLQLHAQPADAIAFFWCEHKTPQLIWHSHLRPHGNGTHELASVVIHTGEPVAQAVACAKFFGIEPHSAATLPLHPSSLQFVPFPDAAGCGMPHAVLTFGTHSLEQLTDELDMRSVAWASDAVGGVLLRSTALAGITLRFVSG